MSDSITPQTIPFDSVEKDSNTVCSMKGHRVTDLSLHPEKGILNCRQDRFVQHLPCATQFSSSYCQLHYGATGHKTRKNCSFCTHCRTALCVKCYIPFHSVMDLVGSKKSLALSYAEETEVDHEVEIVRISKKRMKV